MRKSVVAFENLVINRMEETAGHSDITVINVDLSSFYGLNKNDSFDLDL